MLHRAGRLQEHILPVEVFGNHDRLQVRATAIRAVHLCLAIKHLLLRGVDVDDANIVARKLQLLLGHCNARRRVQLDVAPQRAERPRERLRRLCPNVWDAHRRKDLERVLAVVLPLAIPVVRTVILRLQLQEHIVVEGVVLIKRDRLKPGEEQQARLGALFDAQHWHVRPPRGRRVDEWHVERHERVKGLYKLARVLAAVAVAAVARRLVWRLGVRRVVEKGDPRLAVLKQPRLVVFGVDDFLLVDGRVAADIELVKLLLGHARAFGVWRLALASRRGRRRRPHLTRPVLRLYRARRVR